jgi:hypothetical protein
VKELFFAGNDPSDTFSFEFRIRSRHIVIEVNEPMQSGRNFPHEYSVRDCRNRQET